MNTIISTIRFTVYVILLGAGVGVSAESVKREQEKPTPIKQSDFKPTSEYGFDAMMTALSLGKQIIDENTSGDGIERAEGYRFLFRQIEMHLATLSDDTDPTHPILRRCPSKNCKLGFDNPDYTYSSFTPMSPDYTYRLYGHRGNAELILFQVLEMNPNGAFGGSARSDSDSMVFDEDGNWEIVLSAKRPKDVPASNWLKLSEYSRQLVIRITHKDWNISVEPSVQIEVLEEVDESVPAFSPQRMASAGYAFSRMLPQQVARWARITRKGELNGVDEPCTSWTTDCSGVGGFGNFSAGGKYELRKDQALIIEAPWVPARYRNIQLANVWAESLDYASRQTSLNDFQANPDSDGVVRYILAHEDPGVANWLDISGHPRGAIFMRWVDTEEGKDPVRPSSKVVPLAEVRKHLPADTRLVSPTERAKILKQRLAGYNRRMNPANIH